MWWWYRIDGPLLPIIPVRMWINTCEKDGFTLLRYPAALLRYNGVTYSPYYTESTKIRKIKDVKYHQSGNGSRRNGSWYEPIYYDPPVMIDSFGVQKFKIDIKNLETLKMQPLFNWTMMVKLKKFIQ